MTTAEMRVALGLDDSFSDLQVISQWALLNSAPAPVPAAAIVAVDPPAPSPEQAALAAIRATFADPEPVIYTQAGVALAPIFAIRIDHAAEGYQGPGKTTQSVAYEIFKGDLPARPKNGETLTHRGRQWRIGDVTDLADVDAWLVAVSDIGPAL